MKSKFLSQINIEPIKIDDYQEFNLPPKDSYEDWQQISVSEKKITLTTWRSTLESRENSNISTNLKLKQINYLEKKKKRNEFVVTSNLRFSGWNFSYVRS